MRAKKIKILSNIYLVSALLSFIICVWNVIICGLFAPAVDIRGGVGVAMVCTLALLIVCGLMALIGLDMRKKFTAKTFKYTLGLAASALFSLIFLLIGGYNVIPALLGLALPGVTLFFIK